MPPRWARRALGLLLLAHAAYAAAFVARTSFEVEGQRVFNLFDDAMVSMRYARNLVQGHGLVWNAGGERVEGFSNPLWVGLMALAHVAVPDRASTSLVIQVVSALLLVANLVIVVRLSGAVAADRPAPALAAAFFTAFYLPLNNWSLQGMEVALLTPWLGLALLLAVRGTTPGRLALLLGGLPLVRLDAALAAAVVLLGAVALDPRERRRRLGWGVLAIAGCLLLQTLARWAYYGELLPNTYALKVEGGAILPRLAHGLGVAWTFFARMGWVALLLPWVAWCSALDPRRRLPGAVFLAQLVYSVWVGGDAWDWWGGANRFLSPAMPAFFILTALAADDLRRLAPGPLRSAAAGLALLLLPGALVAFNDINAVARDVWLLRTPPLHVVDHAKMVRRARTLQAIAGPGATIAVTAAGTTPYHTDFTFVDLLGKSDRHVARQPMHDGFRRPTEASSPTGLLPPQTGVKFHPGHMKWDYAHSIGALRPDAILESWPDPAAMWPFVRHDFVQVRLGEFVWLLRIGSPHLDWRKIARLGGRPELASVPPRPRPG